MRKMSRCAVCGKFTKKNTGNHPKCMQKLDKFMTEAIKQAALDAQADYENYKKYGLI